MLFQRCFALGLQPGYVLFSKIFEHLYIRFHVSFRYVLALRVADMSTGSMPEAHVRMYLVHSTTDTHGNNCLLMEDLDVGYDCGRDRLILLVPWIIEHRIDAESPLFKYAQYALGH